MKTNGAHAPQYRPDIDGLRALAVIAVILFHRAFQGSTTGDMSESMSFS
jgi:peptidoglycan/LPS O-acetylase OafA/YrhL